MPRRVGILLSGCGLYDGTEVQEAVLTLLALERAGARVELLAPDRPQLDVVDHASMQVAPGESRNILTESCRIGRGRVTPLSQARGEALDALVLPGGYGAVKNWMSGFAAPGEHREIQADVRSLLAHFLERRKPVGVISLAETLVASLSGEPLREDPFSAPASEVRVDRDRNIYQTAGFMASERITEVAQGIDRMISMLLAAASGKADGEA